jgi:anti-sigma regulatory factor (Ser/Thr protein kinase)
MSGVDLLEMELKDGDTPLCELLGTLKDIRQPCVSTVTLLNELLDFEKMDSGLTALDASDLDPCTVFVNTVESFHTMAMETGAVVVYAVESKLSQVLRNLLSNAIKFTPQGGSVSVSATVENDYFTVTVRDSGVGISTTNQLRLFGEGVQFSPNAHQGGGGSGLGLWISKKIVEMHGGSIGASSEGEDKGSTFFFRVPANKSKLRHAIMNAMASRTPSRRPSARVAPLPQEVVPPGFVFAPDLKVLVVDDSAVIRKMMVKRIEKLKCITFEADDGDAAVDMVNASLQGHIPVFDVIAINYVSNSSYLCNGSYKSYVSCIDYAKNARSRGSVKNTRTGIYRSDCRRGWHFVSGRHSAVCRKWCRPCSAETISD